jgi:hypothetical protein
VRAVGGRHGPERADVQRAHRAEPGIGERGCGVGAPVGVGGDGPVGGALLVLAQDRGERFLGVLVVAVGAALVVEVGQAEQHPAVAAAQLVERGRERGPHVLQVERVDGADDGVVVGQRAVADRERLRDQRAHEVLEIGVGLPGGRADRAPRVRHAVGGVGVERLLEARVLVHVAVGGALGGVDRAVEHHRAHVARELLGVERAEERAVGVAEERELRVAEGRPQHVHVARGVAGADVRQHAVAAGALRAPTRVLAVLRLGLGDPGRRRVDVEVGPLGDPFGVGEAVDRRGARADAARVEPDEVEPLAERAVGELRTERRHHAEAGRAGATGVEQQRADARPVAFWRSTAMLAVGPSGAA